VSVSRDGAALRIGYDSTSPDIATLIVAVNVPGAASADPLPHAGQ